MKMPFGKHKGTEIEDLPTDYIIWFCENVKGNEQLVKEMEEQLAMREGQGRVVGPDGSHSEY